VISGDEADLRYELTQTDLPGGQQIGTSSTIAQGMPMLSANL
jgi:hypothetical protein